MTAAACRYSFLLLSFLAAEANTNPTLAGFEQGGFSISRHSVKKNANMIFERAAVSITSHPSVTLTDPKQSC